MDRKPQKPMPRFNTRIREDQQEFLKSEVKKSKGVLSEGSLTRELLDFGIEAYKNKKKK
jgi:hypothetical protein